MWSYQKKLRRWRPQIAGTMLGLILTIVPLVATSTQQRQQTRNNDRVVHTALVIKNSATVLTGLTFLHTAPASPLYPPQPPPLDCSVVACVALTFDDGPDPTTTPKILDALADEHAFATFFLIGSRVGHNQDIVRRMARSRHDIGNHSWSHTNFAKLKSEQIEGEMSKTQQAIAEAGVAVPTIFRPPYGIRTQPMREQVHVPIILWNVDPHDWHEQNPNRIAELVAQQAKPGAIILLHDSKPATADAVSRAIVELKKHYNLVTVTQLLNLTPESHGEFFGR